MSSIEFYRKQAIDMLKEIDNERDLHQIWTIVRRKFAKKEKQNNECSDHHILPDIPGVGKHPEAAAPGH